jgi:hypothetical protein
MEVLIFVAVSGLMFTIAAIAINGKQASAEFKQGMNDMNTQIREAVNDVDNGSYTLAYGTCSANDAGAAPVIGGAVAKQGTNRTCIFLGKAMQFAPNVAEYGDRGYAIYTVIGRQYVGKVSDAVEVTNFAQAKPQVINLNTNVELKRMQWGLTLTKATSAGQPISGVGFYKTFGTYDAGGQLQSGAQNVIAVPIGGELNKTPSDFMTAVETYTNDANAAANNYINIKLCFRGGEKQFGVITIGGENGQRVTTKIKVSDQESVCP